MIGNLLLVAVGVFLVVLNGYDLVTGQGSLWKALMFMAGIVLSISSLYGRMLVRKKPLAEKR